MLVQPNGKVADLSFDLKVNKMNIMKQKGLLTELHCQLAFSELGFLVMTPLSEDSRYDFIVDIGSKLLRIQCKTSSPKEDGSAITFACRSTRSNTQGNISRQYSKEEIDYFYTYYWGKSYLVPVEECSSEKTLRFVKPHSGQTTGISFAKNYELKTVLQSKENIKEFQEITSTIQPLQETDESEFLVKSQIFKERTSICPQCGGPMHPISSLCAECYKIAQRLHERPSREELKNLIRTTPFTQIGKQFNVSDNAIRKWCVSENLPAKASEIKQYSDAEWEKI